MVTNDSVDLTFRIFLSLVSAEHYCYAKRLILT